MDMIGSPTGTGRFVDGFCGTGAVSRAAFELGWRDFLINDSLLSAGVISSARLTSERAARFSNVGGYLSAIGHLDSLSPESGCITKTYSPVSREIDGIERRYFTEHNAGRIDVIRAEIERLRNEGLIDEVEWRVLVADLLLATNAIANTAGTYGCFLREWSPVSLRALELRPRTLVSDETTVEVVIGDIAQLETRSSDVVYLDPPYTKRQYAAYYHILETVAHGDSPLVSGVTGLRPWKTKASDFSYSSRAQDAAIALFSSLEATRIYMSYSSDGFIDLEELVQSLREVGDIAELHPVQEIGRYRPNEVASNRKAVQEWIVRVEKAAS